ncbi:MAG: Na-translocating system protein MpsC family protein [Solirubrobacteraceae bacterium]
MPGIGEGSAGHGVLAAAISNGMVSLMHRYTGRGPVRARTTIDENLVVCVLGDTLTKAEQHLVDAGRTKMVLRGRRAMQDTLAADAIALVSELTKREVVAFMSNNHIAPDLAVETFVLAPVTPV